MFLNHCLWGAYVTRKQKSPLESWRGRGGAWSSGKRRRGVGRGRDRDARATGATETRPLRRGWDVRREEGQGRGLENSSF